MTFEQWISQSAKHGSVNILFEMGMYSLVDELERLVTAMKNAGVAFEVVGGVAVNAHILDRNRSRTFVTRDIDLLVCRAELDRIHAVAAGLGYQATKVMGGYMLRRPDQDVAEAVHLVFAGEKSKSTQPHSHPEVNPELKSFFHLTIPVAPIKDLLRMKLSSMRPKDITHLETLDEAGLITPELERELPHDLVERLAHARQIIADSKPDVEE
jgi:hypothetical protein